ncbi:carbon-nitrogen hydrolase family protein [Actinoplanes sp. NPDC024001]|uniref:carbon-nitrogen hydrolase family protein n=1 Tax=Actinoplanes sp. NPDC024001 TaxID=3154598 RepID=UPI0033ECEBF8
MAALRVGACQTMEIFGDFGGVVQRVCDYAADADAAGVNLMVLPECFLQGYSLTEEHVRRQALAIDSPELNAVLEQLAGVRQTLVLGAIELAGGRYYNTALIILAGRVLGTYRKRFLISGETMFTPGDAALVFDCAGVRFGINICSDTRYPQAAAEAADRGAQVLLVPAQNMMSRDKAVQWQHRHNEIRRQRVRETGMWLVSSDVTGERDGTHLGLGPTCVMDPTGRIVAEVPVGETGMAVAEIVVPTSRHI